MRKTLTFLLALGGLLLASCDFPGFGSNPAEGGGEESFSVYTPRTSRDSGSSSSRPTSSSSRPSSSSSSRPTSSSSSQGPSISSDEEEPWLELFDMYLTVEDYSIYVNFDGNYAVPSTWTNGEKEDFLYVDCMQFETWEMVGIVYRENSNNGKWTSGQIVFRIDITGALNDENDYFFHIGPEENGSRKNVTWIEGVSTMRAADPSNGNTITLREYKDMPEGYPDWKYGLASLHCERNGTPTSSMSSQYSSTWSSSESSSLDEEYAFLQTREGECVSFVFSNAYGLPEMIIENLVLESPAEFVIHGMLDGELYEFHSDILKEGSLGTTAGEDGYIRLEAGSYRLVLQLSNLSPQNIWDGQKYLWIECSTHSFVETMSVLNDDGKTVTLSECPDDGFKEITIDYLDGKYYNQDGVQQETIKTKMDKMAHMEWHINVSSPIRGAQVFFEGTANSNNGRYFFNQNKEVNPVNPVTGEEFPDDTVSNPDLSYEDAWRYMLGVGDVSYDPNALIPLKNGNTYANAGAGTRPMYFGDIDLAAGDNVVSLFQMNVGYRLTFSGKLHIRFKGNANLVGATITRASLVFNGGNSIPLSLNNAAEGVEEYFVAGLELTPDTPFYVNIIKGNGAYDLGWSIFKAECRDLVGSNNEGQICVQEAGLYNIFIDVTFLSPTNLEEIAWIEHTPELEGEVFYWNDVIAEGSTEVSSDCKIAKNATYTFNLTLPAAGRVVLMLTMKGSNSNGNRTINGTGQDFTVSCNGNEGTVLGAGKTYDEYFGEDQTAWVQVAFAEFDVVAGLNTLVISTGNGGYRLSVDTSAPMRLIYNSAYTRPQSGDDPNSIYVTYHLGDHVIGSFPVAHGGAASFETTNAPLGYEILGWYTDAALTNPYNNEPVTENIDLYARANLTPSDEVASGAFDVVLANNADGSFKAHFGEHGHYAAYEYMLNFTPLPRGKSGKHYVLTAEYRLSGANQDGLVHVLDESVGTSIRGTKPLSCSGEWETFTFIFDGESFSENTRFSFEVGAVHPANPATGFDLEIRDVWIEEATESMSFYWNDALEDGSDSLQSGALKSNATYTFTVNAPKAGLVALCMTMRPGGSSSFDSARSLSFTANGKSGTFLADGAYDCELFWSYSDAWKEVYLATFEVVAGTNTIVLSTGLMDPSLFVDTTKAMILVYMS